jgi:hypothetical protein
VPASDSLVRDSARKAGRKAGPKGAAFVDEILKQQSRDCTRCGRQSGTLCYP